MNPSLTFPTGRGRLFVLAAAAVFVCLLPAPARAQKTDRVKLDVAARRAGKAVKVLADLIALPPGVDRVNVLVAKMMKGYGLVSRRVPEGWGTPAFLGFAVIDRGWTLLKPGNAGVVMLIMDDDTLKKFQKDGFEPEAAPGPVGEVVAHKMRRAGILIYGLSDGELRGIEVEDDDTTTSAINSDNHINKAVYGLRAREVLSGKTPAAAELPPAIAEFQNALTSLSKQ